jgi:hypothetical protein
VKLLIYHIFSAIRHFLHNNIESVGGVPRHQKEERKSVCLIAEKMWEKVNESKLLNPFQ